MDINFSRISIPIPDRQKLSKEIILSKITEREIFVHYLGFELSIGKSIKSPLRKDKNPSFCIYQNAKGNLLFKDFGTGDTGDCFQLVMNKYDINFWECLKLIDRDFSLELLDAEEIPISVKPKIDTKLPKTTEKAEIAIIKQSFTREDYLYWKQFNISLETLSLFNVVSCKCVFINQNLVYRYSRKQPIYAYCFSNGFKIYRPYSNKKNKFRTNVPNVLQGAAQLPETDSTLIITSSLKDVMCLYEMGYSAVAPQSESTFIPPEIIEKLKDKFDNVYLLFDTDYDKEENYGKLLGEKIASEHDIKQIEISVSHKSTDIAELIQNYNFKFAKGIIENELQ